MKGCQGHRALSLSLRPFKGFKNFVEADTIFHQIFDFFIRKGGEVYRDGRQDRSRYSSRSCRNSAMMRLRLIEFSAELVAFLTVSFRFQECFDRGLYHIPLVGGHPATGKRLLKGVELGISRPVGLLRFRHYESLGGRYAIITSPQSRHNSPADRSAARIFSCLSGGSAATGERHGPIGMPSSVQRRFDAAGRRAQRQRQPHRVEPQLGRLRSCQVARRKAS